jgi:hypothetical protein
LCSSCFAAGAADGAGAGYIKATALSSVLTEVGLHLSETQLAQCLTDLGLMASSQVTFAMFVKAIYLIQVAGM